MPSLNKYDGLQRADEAVSIGTGDDSNDVSGGAIRRTHLKAIAQQQTLVAAAVADDFDSRRDARVALDQTGNRGAEAGGEPAGSENRNFFWSHGAQQQSECRPHPASPQHSPRQIVRRASSLVPPPGLEPGQAV